MLTFGLVVGIALLVMLGGLLFSQRQMRLSREQSIEQIQSAARGAEWELQQVTRQAFEAMTAAARAQREQQSR